MANRVSATIEIGGTLPASMLDAFERVVQSEALSTQWEGAPFTRSDIPADRPLRLVDHDVAWGRFDELEAFCRDHGLPYARWCDGYGGDWGPQRVVFDGSGDPVTYAATEDDSIVIDLGTIEVLGTLTAVRAHFDAANFAVPALQINA